jgi:ribosome biogenesis GTPase
LKEKRLNKYNFNEELINELNENENIGRIIIENRGLYRLVDQDMKEINGKVSGKFSHECLKVSDYPSVGDFVSFKSQGDLAIISKVLKRKTSFGRKVAGNKSDEQIVCSNIDYVFLVMALNNDFNIRRLERYITVTYNSGAMPVIILTKKDLVSDINPFLLEVESIAFGIDVHFISSIHDEGLDAIEKYLNPGVTIAMLGSSGAGKSTLINKINGKEILQTQEIRFGDDRGKHTTTHRQLVFLQNGAMVIDTPGMRELGLSNEDGDFEVTFDDIDSLAQNCRFSDCKHKAEPGCAIKEAINNGTLEEARLQSYFKLQREMRIINAKQQGNLRRELNKMHKERMAGKL